MEEGKDGVRRTGAQDREAPDQQAQDRAAQDQFEGLGAALRCLREDRGLTQAQVAESCGTARRVINSIETGRNIPRIATIEAVLETLGSDLFELLNALETTNGRPRVRFHRFQAGPEPRRQRLVELLGLEELSAAKQALFLSATEDLRNLFAHLTAVTESLGEENRPPPDDPTGRSETA